MPAWILEILATVKPLLNIINTVLSWLKKPLVSKEQEIIFDVEKEKKTFEETGRPV